MRGVLLRLASVLLTFWLAYTCVFVLLRIIPGDALAAELLQAGLPQDVIEARRAALGLDAPLLTQYTRSLFGLLEGKLGVSLATGRPVSEMIAERLRSTLELALAAGAVGLIVGVGLGLFAGFAGGWLRWLAVFLLGLSLSVPLYWTATLLLFVFSLRTLDNLWLAAGILGFHTAGAIARVLQAQIDSLRRVLFIRTAYSKGLPTYLIRWRHVLRVAGLPLISVAALQAGFLLGGVVITESIFQRAGLGTLLLRGVVEQDYPVVQGVTLLLVLVYVALNTLADGLLVLADPRLRIDEMGNG